MPYHAPNHVLLSWQSLKTEIFVFLCVPFATRRFSLYPREIQIFFKSEKHVVVWIKSFLKTLLGTSSSSEQTRQAWRWFKNCTSLHCWYAGWLCLSCQILCFAVQLCRRKTMSRRSCVPEPSAIQSKNERKWPHRIVPTMTSGWTDSRNTYAHLQPSLLLDAIRESMLFACLHSMIRVPRLIDCPTGNRRWDSNAWVEAPVAKWTKQPNCKNQGTPNECPTSSASNQCLQTFSCWTR